ncbi:MAG: phosphatase PAP2 family protein [Ghiorsea sp.]
MGLWSGFGDGMVVVLLMFMLMLFRLRLGLAGLLALTSASLMTQIIKRTLEMPRPPAVFEHVHLLGDSLFNYSFPSGHSTACGVMALLALLVFQDSRKLGWAIFTGFLVAAYGRMYGGVHFPLDVVVGLGTGMVMMYWCEKKSRHWNTQGWLKSEWSWKIPGFMVMLTAVILGTGYEVKPNTAQILAFILPITALFALMHAWKKKLH